jgi:hypothetical protein
MPAGGPRALRCEYQDGSESAARLPIGRFRGQFDGIPGRDFCR